MKERPERLALFTNAKINLFLQVGARRTDGYHEISTIFHSVSLADTVEVTPRAGGGVAVVMRPEGVADDDLPAPEDNLVTRALSVFARHTGRPLDMEVRITKRIPLAGGLAGGSADAAGALVAANRSCGEPLDGAALGRVAAEVGSDVPFCLVGGTALGSGRGELLEELESPRLHFVLGLSRERLVTGDVYARARSNASGPGARDLAAVLASGNPSALAAALRNDLEPAAAELLPALESRKEALLAAGALGAALCGSGPSLFGLARDEEHARAVAAAARRSFDRVEVVRSRPFGIEPAPQTPYHER